MSAPNMVEAKAPRRARGHARVAALLEAASAEFAEKGYEATTMTAIAARAESSIGSLYQFFPTKEQVAGTLLEQYVVEIEGVFERLRKEASSLDVSVVAGRLTTLFVAFRTKHPAFVMLADVQDVALPGALPGASVRERLRKGVGSVLAAVAPRLSEKDALLRAAVVQHLMKAAVTLSHDTSVADHKATMLEFQRVVQRYLEDVIEAAQSEQAGQQTGRAPRGAARAGRASSGDGAGPKGRSGNSA